MQDASSKTERPLEARAAAKGRMGMLPECVSSPIPCLSPAGGSRIIRGTLAPNARRGQEKSARKLERPALSALILESSRCHTEPTTGRAEVGGQSHRATELQSCRGERSGVSGQLSGVSQSRRAGDSKRMKNAEWEGQGRSSEAMDYTGPRNVESPDRSACYFRRSLENSPDSMSRSRRIWRRRPLPSRAEIGARRVMQGSQAAEPLRGPRRAAIRSAFPDEPRATILPPPEFAA
jgi:hypothetical protein